MTTSFKPIVVDDLPVVKEIYDWYIMNTTSTFHVSPIGVEELLEFIHIDHAIYKSFMIWTDDAIAGYCLLTHHKKRPAYDRTAEITVYLRPAFHGRGLGKSAIQYLEQTATSVGLKNLIGVITGDNTNSIELFERLGYMKCAHFRNVGEKFGKVLDVVAYQKEL